jgi:N-acetyl-anhydromuramyl-L-alanine amidase AmpD
MTHPDRIQGANWNLRLKEPRIGCMVHYDGSITDAGSIAWLAGPDIKVSYNYIVMDSGNIIPIAPETARAWHAGVCRTADPRLPYADANSAFYGVSISATLGDVATVEAKRSVAALCRRFFANHGWGLDQTWRIVSHRAHAWPRGRKNDPEGADLAHPVLSTNEIRGMVAAMLPGGAPA